MGRIKLLASGQIKDSAFRQLNDDYIKRIRKYHQLEIHEFKEKKYSEQDPSKYFSEYAREIENKLEPGDGIVSFISTGKTVSSEELAGLIESLINSSRTPVFLIGGSIGLPDTVLKKSQHQISFGRVTFPHKLFRTMALEQIYRALTIIKGEPYHK